MFARNQGHNNLQSYFLKTKEDPPMTMQVGMVGTDGVLLASDTLCHRDQGVRSTFNSSKFIIDHERRIAITLAVDLKTARRIAEAIIFGVQDIGNSEDIEKMASNVCVGSSETIHAECLIALSTTSPRLFYLESDGSLPVCEERRDKGVAGDKSNAAVFFLERYYQRLPIKQLVPLAAHFIVSAHLLNPSGIHGLDIVLCDSSGIHRLSDDSIGELESKANGWDRYIGNLFLR